MEPIMELVNAMNALTIALQKMTEKMTGEYISTFETIYDPSKKDKLQESSKPAVAFEQLRSVLSKKSRDGHTDKVKALIEKYGASRLSEVKEEDYTALLAEAEAI